VRTTSYILHFPDQNVFPQSSQRETEIKHRGQQAILVPNEVSSTHSQRNVVIQRESRARLTTRRETTVVERMVSGKGSYINYSKLAAELGK
jgi:hypothetical protein